MLIPKIIFKYSRIYDEIWKGGLIIRMVENYPSAKQILNYIKKIERLWQKEEKRVLRELTSVTCLKWKSEFIYCYIVGRSRPFSDPLTIPVYEKHLDYFIDVLIHELIHNLFVQNSKEMQKIRRYFNQRYKEESQRTKIHIPIHAIHSHIYLKFYNEKRLKRDVNLSKQDYRKSWMIVQKEGYKNIINEFVKRV